MTRSAVLLALLGVALPPTARAGEAEDGWSVYVGATEEVRLRQAGAARLTEPTSEDPGVVTPGVDDAFDGDLRVSLFGDARDAADRLSLEVSLALWADVDGLPEEGTPTQLASQRDGGQVLVEPYALSARWRPGGAVRMVQVGRQTAWAGPASTLDGATVVLAPGPRMLEVFAFGGRTVHFFEVDAGAFEDWVASGGVTLRPHPTLRLDVDYRYLREDTVVADGVEDHSWGGVARLRLGETVALRAEGRALGRWLATAGGQVSWQDADLGMGATAQVAGQLISLREVNEQDDPFFAVLGASKPHLRGRVDVWKSVDTELADAVVHAGWAARAVREADAGPFNRDSGRLYVLAMLSDLGVKGPFLSLTGEWHYAGDVPTREGEDRLAVGGAAGYAAGDLRAEVGTAYQRYRYDYYRDIDELADVRAWHATVRVPVLDWLRLSARYVLEQAADRTVHTGTLALSQRW